MKSINLLFVLFILFSLTNCGDSEDKVQSEKTIQLETQRLDLPEKYSVLLRREMMLVESNMMKLLPALVKGKSEKGDSLATTIHNGFILKQELSKNELKELKNLLPEGFIRLDQRFHKNAKKVAELSKKNDFESAVSIFNEMTKSCVACHSHYAQDKFTNLRQE